MSLKTFFFWTQRAKRIKSFVQTFLLRFGQKCVCVCIRQVCRTGARANIISQNEKGLQLKTFNIGN